MQVREIMTSPAITVLPDTKIQEVARIMREHQISSLPVVDEDGQLLGAVTDLSLIARSAPLKQPHYLAVLSAMIPVGVDEYHQYKEQLRQALATNAGELMNTEIKTVDPSTSLEKALEIMLDPANTLLPVIENEGVIGVVTRTDLVRLIEKLEEQP